MKTMKKLLFTATMAAWALAASAVTDILGDVNFDDRVDAKDASWMLAEYASQSTSQGTTFTDPQQKINADVDGNGVVDAVDAGLALRFYSYLSTGGEGTMEEWLARTGTGATGDGNPDAAVNKPVLTVTVDGTAGGKVFDPADAPGKQVACTIGVSGANKAYAATGFRVRYDARLALATDDFGEIDVMSGGALARLATDTPVEDPTAPTGTKGFFVASAGQTNYGLDGTMWTFSFTVPEDAAAGDVYPIDIVAGTTGTPHDLFVDMPVTAAGLDMQAYAFSKGVFSAANPNAFGTGADVAACAALAGIAGDADGYIAIADPAPVTYPLWVGGVQVFSTNRTDILGDGTASFEGTATNGTLYLSNARITEAIEYSGTDTAGIYSGEGFDLTISLTGSNRVENAASGNTDSGVYARANLAITGGGTLVAEMTGQYGIFAYDNLRIDGATVTVSAGDTGLSFGNMLAISNATVTATGTSSYGIYCSGTNGRIDIADSVVTATGGTEGLYARGTGSSLAVSGASVVTAVTTSDDDVAFSAAALVLGDGLAVTEPAGGVFGEDGWGSGCVIDPATGAPAKRVVIAAPPAVFPLWVGGVQVCETNQNDILGDGTASFAGSASGGTLSLSNATITATHQFEDEWSSGSNTATVFSGEGFDLTISLAGSNILQNADHPLISDQGHGYGVRSQGNLAITGGGALVAWVEYNGAGIDTDGNLLIDEAVVTAHSGQDGIRVGGSLAISNAVVTAYGVDYGGISGGDGDIDIADSVVTATGWAGIEADGHTVAVSGASVVTAEATWGDESAWALCASALVLGDGLAISEPAGGVFGENEWGAKCVLDPATGKAALRVVIAPVEFYPLWVGGVQVCTTNQNDILGDGTASFVPSASGGTLSLSNATITATSVHPVIDVTANIFSDSGFDLTISLAGSNRVECGEIAGNLGFCVCARANLAISGEGTLVAEMIGGYTKGIVTYGNLRIDGATVTASAGDTGLRFGGTLVISNATVTATGTSSSYGIYCSRTNGRIDIADSVVTATGCSGGLVAPAGTIAISGASVVTAVATNDNESGIYTKTLVPSDGLAITEPAGGTFSGDPSSNWNAVIDPATGKAALRVVIDRRFAVTVEGGSTTNTTARAGETVTIVANAPAEGEGFVEWSADDAMDLSFARADAATTTFTMPARAVTVAAVFKELQIAPIPDQEWTGEPIEPAFESDTVTFVGVDTTLLPGRDYEVSYTNNVDPGTATATVTMAPPRTGHASVTFQILPPPVPPSVSNVVARQRWPWNGLVDVDYEVGGDTNLLAGVTARITFEERIEGGTGRIWVASNFLAGAEPSVEPGLHRATWDTAADGVTGVVAAVKATVNLVGTGNEKGLELVNKTVIVTPVDPDSIPSCVEINGNYYLLTNDPKGVGIDFRFGSGCDSAKLGDVVGITLDQKKVKEFFGTAESLQFVPSEGVKLVDPATGDKVDSLEENADGDVTFFVTADQVVPGGSITVHGDDITVVIDNINFYDSVPEGWVGVVVTSAASAEFRLDTREGPLPSDGTETLAYSTLWHPAGDATVTILQDGEEEPVAAELAGEGDIVWQVFEDGTYTLTHKTMAGDATVSAEETATFVVTGHPPVEAALRWKYAKNGNGWHCAQVALTWHPSYADEISDMRLLFADRYEDSEPLAVIKVLDDDQAAFFEVPEMIKMAGNDWKYYFLNDENGKVYSERFLESGYREKLDERPTVSDGDELGDVSGWKGSDSYITNGVLNAAGTGVSFTLASSGEVQVKFASSPHGLGRRTAYLVDPAAVIDPLGTTETYRDVEYRVAPVDLTAFAGLADGARAVYGVSDATMASSLDSVPKAERKICLRVVNRDYSTVGRVDNKLAILAWNVGGSPRFLPIAETMSSLQDGRGAPQPAPQPAPRPLSVAEANLSASFGLAPAAVARGAVTCRVSSMSFGEDGSVEGTFAVAAENAGGVVAESGELAGNVKLTVLGAERLGGAFDPLDPSCGAELLSRKPPYAFRVKAPGDNAFFKVRLEAEDVFE